MVLYSRIKRRSLKDMKRIVVVGSGLMGSGIAQVCAQAGMEVVLSDVSQEALARARKNIAWSVDKFIAKGRVQEDRTTVLNRIQTVTD
jgi:3-hydroxybutyryl-CoA dehydrogenase